MNALLIHVDQESRHVAMARGVFLCATMTLTVTNACATTICLRFPRCHCPTAIVPYHRWTTVHSNHANPISNASMSIRTITHASVQTVHRVRGRHSTERNDKDWEYFSYLDERFVAAFYANSYIKRPPLQPIEHAGKFTLEIWFLSESASGMSTMFWDSFFKMSRIGFRFTSLQWPYQFEERTHGHFHSKTFGHFQSDDRKQNNIVEVIARHIHRSTHLRIFWTISAPVIRLNWINGIDARSKFMVKRWRWSLIKNRPLSPTSYSRTMSSGRVHSRLSVTCPFSIVHSTCYRIQLSSKDFAVPSKR